MASGARFDDRITQNIQDGIRIETWRRLGDDEDAPVLLIWIGHRDELGVVRESAAESLPNACRIVRRPTRVGCR